MAPMRYALLEASLISSGDRLSIIQYHQSVVDHAKEAERVQPGRPLAVALDTVRTKQD